MGGEREEDDREIRRTDQRGRKRADRGIPVEELRGRSMRMNRRAALGAFAALAGIGLGMPSARAAQASKTRLILLGTGGGPRPRAASSGSAQVIVANGAAYVVD